jgi:multimeric flavodoxin WrbA
MLLGSYRMTSVILSAGSPQLPALQALELLVRAELTRKGESNIRTFELATLRLAYCQGEFDCWVKTPGVCRSHDAEQEIVQAIHDADNLVVVDAVTFGGHSFIVKRAQDRLICLLSPFFEKRTSLTHHGARYAKQANLFALGWLPAPDPAQARLWGTLADANALNMLASRVGATVVDDLHRDEWAAEVCAMLSSLAHPGANIQARGPLRDDLLAAARPAPSAARPLRTRRAAFLVGSAKIEGTSLSENLARSLAERMKREGVDVEIHFATDFVHDGKAAMTVRAIVQADLFVLVTPLYVDAVPALATRALELVAKARPAAGARFVAIVNCGFPEPEQTRTAMRIARTFADAAGYHWAGGLPLGGGGAVKPDVPLDQQHGAAGHVKRALDAAALALVLGADVPADALELMIAPAIPDFAYRLMGDLGWRYRAHRNGLAQRELHARPLD